MGDLIKDSIVNYHAQQFGNVIEALYVNGTSNELSDLVVSQEPGWCPLRETQNKSTGYLLDFDVTDLDVKTIKLDVFDDVLRISATPLMPSNANNEISGKEFGLFQVIHLPPDADAEHVAAHLDGKALKIWIPRVLALVAKQK